MRIWTRPGGRSILAIIAAVVVIGAGFAWATTRGVTVEPCTADPSDPLCVSLDIPGSSEGITSFPIQSQPGGTGASPLPSPTSPVTYSFSDDFNGPTLSSAWGNHWGTVTPGLWSGSNATVGDGVLTLTADRGPSGWEGALIDTFDSFRQRYGMFSARLRIPEGRGLWATFWLGQDWRTSRTEVDIAEVCANPPGTHDGNDVTLVHEIIHAADGVHTGSHGVRFPDFSSDWHVIALDWRPDHMSFSIDGVEVWRFVDVANIPSEPMAVILDQTAGGWCGLPDATTPSPAVMQVDWVRVTA